MSIPAMPPQMPAVEMAKAPDSRRSTVESLLIAQSNEATPKDVAPQTYPYFSLSVGGGFPSSLNGTNNPVPGAPVSLNTNLPLNSGFASEIAAGYKFQDSRVEIGVGYGSFANTQQNYTVNVNLPGTPAFSQSTSRSGSGTVNYLSIMLNGYYDFPLRQSNGAYSRWRPYIGAGLGLATITTPSCFAGACFQGGNNAGAFAYQGKVGISYRAIKTGDIFVEGAYLGTAGFTVNTVNYDNFGSFRAVLGWRQKL